MFKSIKRSFKSRRIYYETIFADQLPFITNYDGSSTYVILFLDLDCQYNKGDSEYVMLGVNHIIELLCDENCQLEDGYTGDDIEYTIYSSCEDDKDNCIRHSYHVLFNIYFISIQPN